MHNIVFLLIGVAIGAAAGDLARPWLQKRKWGSSAIATLLGLTILMAVGYSAFTTSLRNAGFDCALQARAEATKRSNEAAIAHINAQEAFLSVAFNQNASIEQRRAAGAEYYKTLAEYRNALLNAEQVRNDNPLLEGTCP